MSFFFLPKPKVWRRRRKRARVRQRRLLRELRAKDWTPQDWFFRLPTLDGGLTETPQQKQAPRRVAPSRLSPAPHLLKTMRTVYRCRLTTGNFPALNRWWDSDKDLSSLDVVCRKFADLDGEDVEQPKPVAIGTLDPYRNADTPGTEAVDPASPEESFARDKDGTLVPEGTPYDTGPFAALLRFPTRFLPDSLANGVTVRAVPVLFWGLVAFVIWKAFRNR